MEPAEATSHEELRATLMIWCLEIAHQHAPDLPRASRFRVARRLAAVMLPWWRSAVAAELRRVAREIDPEGWTAGW